MWHSCTAAGEQIEFLFRFFSKSRIVLCTKFSMSAQHETWTVCACDFVYAKEWIESWCAKRQIFEQDATSKVKSEDWRKQHIRQLKSTKLLLNSVTVSRWDLSVDFLRTAIIVWTCKDIHSDKRRNIHRNNIIDFVVIQFITTAYVRSSNRVALFHRIE